MTQEQKRFWDRHNRMERIFSGFGAQFASLLIAVVQDAERACELMQEYFEANGVERSNDAFRHFEDLESRFEELELRIEKFWTWLEADDEGLEVVGEEETIRVSELPSEGDCAVCGKPVRVWAHKSVIGYEFVDFSRSPSRKRVVYHAKCYLRTQEEL